MTVQNIRLRILPQVPPVDGREVEFQATATHIQWRYTGEESWTNLIALAAIQGPVGPDTEFRNNGSYIQARPEGGGDEDWQDIVALSAIQGPSGTLQIGTVTTVAAGEAAKVSNSGTETDAVIDFEIPQGVPGDIQMAVNRTALAALDTGAGTAYLREAGRQGFFQWDSSDLSAKVSVDTLQGVYVAPAGDATGASGAWVRILAGNKLTPLMFGAAYDGTTDDSAAVLAAVALLEDQGGGVLFFPFGVCLVSQEVRIKAPILLEGVGNAGYVGSNPSGAYTGSLPPYGSVLRATGSTPFKLVHARAAVDGNFIWGFGVRGLALDCNRIATHAIHHVNCRGSRFDLQIGNPTAWMILEEAMGFGATKVTNDNLYEYVAGNVSNNFAECTNCNGIGLLGGDVNGYPVGAVGKYIRIATNQGVPMEIGGMDGGHFDFLQLSRNNSSPDLVLLGAEVASNGVLQGAKCRKNYFAAFAGFVQARTGSYANQIGYMQSEFGGVDIQSGATLRYTVHDRTHGDWFVSPDFRIYNETDLLVRDFRAGNAGEPTFQHVGTRHIGVLSFPDSSTTETGVYIPLPETWNDGTIYEITLYHQKGSSGVEGDVNVTVRCSGINTGIALAALTYQTQTITMAGGMMATTFTGSETTDREDLGFAINVSRQGGDASDTYAADWYLVGVKVRQKSAPNSPGAGGYDIGSRYLD